MKIKTNKNFTHALPPPLWGGTGRGLLLFLLLLLLSGCITEYEATEIKETAGILVVEGIIADEESVITLSRSINLSDRELYNPVYVDNANVYIECEDGTQWSAEPHELSWWSPPRNGKYVIKTSKLDTNRKYRLKIEIEELDQNCVTEKGYMACPTKTYQYVSDYSYPIKTPEIDNLFWTKRAQREPVNIYISTYSVDNQVLYYRWTYKEDWEINSVYSVPGYPYFCWSTYKSREILLGSAEKTTFGQLTDKILELSPSDRKLSVLYRITVTQNAISKRAYDYFANIKKNSEQIGSIFAPIPSELRGNIVCTTDPTRPVIGYIEISSTTQKTMYISGKDVYERHSICTIEQFEEPPPPGSGYIPYEDGYVFVGCVDCTYYGTTPKPEDWPK